MSMNQRLSITVEESETPDAQTVVEITSTLDDDTHLTLKFRASTLSLKANSRPQLEPVWRTFLSHIRDLTSDLSSNAIIGPPPHIAKSTPVGQSGMVAVGQSLEYPRPGLPKWVQGSVCY